MNDSKDFIGAKILFFNACSLWPHAPTLMQTVTNITGFLYGIHCEHKTSPIENSTGENYLFGVPHILTCSCHEQFLKDYQLYRQVFLQKKWEQFNNQKKKDLIEKNLPNLYFLCHTLDENDLLSQLPQMNLKENDLYNALYHRFCD